MRLSYITIIGFLLFALSCSEEVSLSKDVQEPAVYLAVTRAQEAESINDDETDFEDRVHSLVLLVFDSSSGTKVGESFENPAKETFTVKLTPGQRNFYFIANMPEDELKTIKYEVDVKKYMNELRNLDPALYLKATANKGFPMSRVYTNQTVSEGGTFYQPTPFKLTVDQIPEDKVKLVRAVAKLEITVADKLKDQIETITYHNANRNYNLSTPTAPETYYGDEGKVALNKNEDGVYRFYMPEAIMPANTKWSETNDPRPINYFTIKFVNDPKSYQVPIITNGPQSGENADYLSFAKGNNANYDILRNDHYIYHITKTAKGIQILYDILPWNLIKKNLFMGYWFNLELGDDGSIRIINTIDDCLPHKVTLEALNGASFPGNDPIDKIEYGYETEEKLGGNTAMMKEGYYKDYKIDDSAVAVDKEYLKVYYNGNLVKTYIKK